MKIIVNNDNTIIYDFSESLGNAVKNLLSYEDKSKKYQIKKMAKSVWLRNSPLYKKLLQQVNGVLYEIKDNSIIFPTTFFNEFESFYIGADITDNRTETGTKIICPWVEKPFDTRAYQEEAVDLMMSNNRGLINMATGLGKTLIATHFIQRYKKKALVVCPSDSVAKQFYDLFVEAFGKNKVGFYGGGKKKIGDITVGIAASITRSIDEFKTANLGVVIIDETHHTPATTFFDISQGLASVGKIFGLTATDYRSDGKDIMIAAGCGPVLIRRDIKWGVNNGFLAEPYFIIREVGTDGIDFKYDKLKSYKEHILNSSVMKSRIESDAVAMMKGGKSVLILVDEIVHGEELSKALGIPFATGDDKNSQEYIGQLNSGKIKGLVGTDSKIGEGSDTKNVDVLIMANFVASKGPVIQCVGRALRKQNLKTKALVLDYIPMGSTMMKRHALQRVNYYLDITNKVKYIALNASE